ncbi:HNH endonuclease [Streptomyces sp. NPDC002346]
MVDVEWRDVDGFPGYAVSSDGQVMGKRGTVLTPKKSGRQGRHMVSLTNRTRRTNGKPIPGTECLTPIKYAYIHRLVCQAFHGASPSDDHEVGHLNGDHLDNRAANLRWVTAKENQQHRVEHGTSNQGEQNPAARLTAADVRSIRARVAKGEMNRDIAAAFGVSTSLVSQIRTGRAWASVENH